MVRLCARVGARLVLPLGCDGARRQGEARGRTNRRHVRLKRRLLALGAADARWRDAVLCVRAQMRDALVEGRTDPPPHGVWRDLAPGHRSALVCEGGRQSGSATPSGPRERVGARRALAAVRERRVQPWEWRRESVQRRVIPWRLARDTVAQRRAAVAERDRRARPEVLPSNLSMCEGTMCDDTVQPVTCVHRAGGGAHELPKAERYLRAQRTDVATTFRAACCRYRCDGATRGARRTHESRTVCVWKLRRVPATSLFYSLWRDGVEAAS